MNETKETNSLSKSVGETDWSASLLDSVVALTFKDPAHSSQLTGLSKWGKALAAPIPPDHKDLGKEQCSLFLYPLI